MLQKALGKSTASRQNTRYQRPANRIPELCAPITRAHPRSRDLFTPADPPRPTCTPRPHHRAPRLHLPVMNTRARGDRVQVVPTETEATPSSRRALPGLWHFAVGTDPVSNFPSLRTGPGSSGVPVPLPSHLWLLMPVHSHLQPLTRGNSHLQPLTPRHSLQGQWGRGGSFISLRTPGWNILNLHFLKVFTLIAVF